MRKATPAASATLVIMVRLLPSRSNTAERYSSERGATPAYTRMAPSAKRKRARP